MKVYRLMILKVDIPSYSDVKTKILHHEIEAIISDSFYDIPVHSKHDDLFGKFHIIFYTYFLFIKRNIGFVEIRNSQMNESSEIDLEILSSTHLGTYLTFNTKKTIIGKITVKFIINNLPTILKPTGDFPIFKNILFQNKIFFLANLLVPLIEGSTICRFKCLKGLYILIKLFFNMKQIQQDIVQKNVPELDDIFRDRKHLDGETKAIIKPNPNNNTDVFGNKISKREYKKKSE
ncbi:hypothetical protein M153_13038000121, partial [Pseudoloma neurophilia]